MSVRFTKEETQKSLENAWHTIHYDYKSLIWSSRRTYYATWYSGGRYIEAPLHQKTAKEFFEKQHRDRFGKSIPYIVMEKGEIFPN